MQNNNDRPKKYYIHCCICEEAPPTVIFHQPTACYFCIEHFREKVPGEYHKLENWVLDHFDDGGCNAHV